MILSIDLIKISINKLITFFIYTYIYLYIISYCLNYISFYKNTYLYIHNETEYKSIYIKGNYKFAIKN